jgi:hypothetical protein
MKTREIDVWVTRANDYTKDDFYIAQSEQPDSVKAKLVIPVEPEIREIEVELYDVDKSNGKQFVTLVFNGDYKWLAGHRWKCRFEEIV